MSIFGEGNIGLNPPVAPPHPMLRNKWWSAYVIILLTLLAPTLGGSTDLWAQAILSLGAGLLLIFAPPQRSLGLWPNLAFALLGALALTAFLPAHWFATADWRLELSKLGLRLTDMRSPQPWLTLESTLLFGLGLAWTYYLLSYDWKGALREQAWTGYAFGILGLASTLIVAFTLGARVPFWPNVQEFGFFPNRNQTSNVLGLGGIVVYANAFRYLQRGKKVGWIWLVGLLPICWALILNYSRAGIILFFAGAFVWHCYSLMAAKRRRLPLITLAVLFLLFGFFLVYGDQTVARFGKETMGLLSPSRNARLGIFRDALNLTGKSPGLGIGLGNFPAIFALHREYSAAQNEVIHPESDWLWTAVEIGWLGPLLLLALFCWWLRRCFPFEPGTFRSMRVAAMICGCAFAIHGIFDVSGHRIGALWPALLLASTAMHPKPPAPSSAATARVFQIIGLLLTAVGTFWLVSATIRTTLPTTATLRYLVSDAETAVVQNDFSSALKSASRGLRIAPLNWTLRHDRAISEAALYFADSEAVQDFMIARYLLPQWPEICFQEGQVWIAVGEEDRAFDAWREALRRSPEQAPNLYARMFNLVKADVALRNRWRELAHTDRRCLFVFFENAAPSEFEIELERLLSEDQQLNSFTPDELHRLFNAWYSKGDKLSLAQTLREHPEWQKIAWRELARTYGDYQDYRQAYETADKFIQPPPTPPPNSQESLQTLKTRFLANRTDVGAGLALYSAQVKEDRIDDALRTLQELNALKGSPKYLSYFEAKLWAQKAQWKEAWQALVRFDFQGN